MDEKPTTPRGRKPLGPNFFQATVTLERGDTAELDDLAAAEGRNRSEMIREAIREHWLKKGRRKR